MNTEIDADPPAPTGDTTASRLWRSIWRTHFYAGWIAAPILVLLAVTGLVILYTEPINARVHDEVVDVDPGDNDNDGRAASFEDQRAAVADAHPDLGLIAVTPPETDEMSTKFSGSDEDEDGAGRPPRVLHRHGTALVSGLGRQLILRGVRGHPQPGDQLLGVGGARLGPARHRRPRPGRPSHPLGGQRRRHPLVPRRWSRGPRRRWQQRRRRRWSRDR